MGHIDVREVTYLLPDGRPLLLEVSFKVGNGAKAALVGPNGAGKTTLLRLIAGEVPPVEGQIVVSGGIGVMRQFLGAGNVHDLLLNVAPQRIREAWTTLKRAEAALRATETPRSTAGTPSATAQANLGTTQAAPEPRETTLGVAGTLPGTAEAMPWTAETDPESAEPTPGTAPDTTQAALKTAKVAPGTPNTTLKTAETPPGTPKPTLGTAETPAGATAASPRAADVPPGMDGGAAGMDGGAPEADGGAPGADVARPGADDGVAFGLGEEAVQLDYAQAISDYADAGGYELEVVWDVCATEALGLPFEEIKDRSLTTLSGGEQKRLMLEALLRGPDEVLLLDEPDNFLDVRGKQWLERAIKGSGKTVLLVSHDRRLLAEAADRIVTVEGRGVWVHGGGFGSYAEARRQRKERLEERRQRWEDERGRLRRLVHTLRQRSANNDALAGAYQSAVTRLERFERAGPPERAPKEQNVRMRLRGGRTGKRAVVCEGLELSGLLRPFSTEIWYGERVGVLGMNGTGKSHFLRLLAGEPIAHTGEARLGARVSPGHFAQTHLRPDLRGRATAEVVMGEYALTRNEAMAALARYELAPAGGQAFETLSGGQQARLQILLLELSGATLLLLDEPTDNLDLASAEALQLGLEGFEGTVLAVTHDRWFTDDLDRYLIFGGDGIVRESADPRWDL